MQKYRELLGDDLRIGYTNSKQLVKRLSMFRITEAELKESMTRILKRTCKRRITTWRNKRDRL